MFLLRKTAAAFSFISTALRLLAGDNTCNASRLIPILAPNSRIEVRGGRNILCNGAPEGNSICYCLFVVQISGDIGRAKLASPKGFLLCFVRAHVIPVVPLK